MASKLLGKGKYGVFDPYHTNKGIDLTAGLHCAEIRRKPQLRSQSPASQSPARRGRNSVGVDNCEMESEGKSANAGIIRILASKNSHSSLKSLDSSGSINRGGRTAGPIQPPGFYSTRAAIPLMQDAFVCKELILFYIYPPASLRSHSNDPHIMWQILSTI